MVLDVKAVESKWQKLWQDAKAFEANADSTKAKFFLTCPYPYMNGFMHLGHLYTYSRGEVTARFKRMQGFNVLFPQAWHCTGSPIESAAQRIKENEPSQIKLMKEMGFSDLEIGKFADPKYWVEYFPKEWKKDFVSLGFSNDFRREFITTDLNPQYDRFIQWQFRKLKEKEYVVLGSHPVVWCPKENMPVPDHSRVQGEGETPQEFTLLKFKLGDAFLIAATLRPETLYGETNVWVKAEAEYVKLKVDDEQWIVSRACAEKLKQQQKTVEEVAVMQGSDLVGRYCIAPLTKKQLLVLPSEFPDPSRGTGVVGSVPSDDPDDYMALRDVQKDEELAKKYGLDVKELAELQPIPIIRSDELGDLPAPKVCEQMKIASQRDRKKLDEAKKLIYKKGFYAGIMNDNAGKYAGIPVERAKDLMKKDLLKAGEADVLYELTGKVVCRCLTPSVVKIVKDQWFLAYGNQKWKEEAREALKRLKLYPEKVRGQFEYVLDWLNDWACTREFGLGSRLPWDQKWVIESLSDSTIYMSYYTIAHVVKGVPLDEVNDALFDYVLLGKGKKPSAAAEKMREEFEYWYPMDFRNSGKDLVQNHLSFSLFNHTAVFPEKHWPLSFGVNGWTSVDGQKMSKSLGNFITIRQIVAEGADAVRMTMLYGGESMDDPNFDREFLRALKPKLESLYDFCTYWHAFKGREDVQHIDRWLDSKVNEIVRDVTPLMEETLFRSALQKAFFDVQHALKWYVKRTKRNPHRETMRKALEVQVLLLAPFAPHLCEELWEKMGQKEFISTMGRWPEADVSRIAAEFDAGESLIVQVLEDVKRVVTLAKVDKLKKVTLFVAPGWTFECVKQVKDALEKTRNISEIIAKVKFPGFEKECAKLISGFVKNPAKLPQHVLTQEKEMHIFFENKEFLKEEFDCDVEFVKAEESKEFKAQQALPGKPAIFVQ